MDNNSSIKAITWVQYLLGPFLFMAILFSDLGLKPVQQNFLAIFTMVVCLWLLTKIPLFVSGTIGVVLSVLFGITKTSTAFAPYAHPIIFLFLGGFLFAKALQSTGLDKKISLKLLASPFIGGSFSRMLIGIFAMTAFFSMWISNTATTAMMLPILLGIFTSLNIQDMKLKSTVLISMAYAASVGGLATPIGSTPNMILMGLLQELIGVRINFFEWMMMGLPIVLVILGFLFLMVRSQNDLHKVNFNNDFILAELRKLSPFTRKEWTLVFFFGLTVFLWFSPSLFGLILGKENEFAKLLNLRLHPGLVAMLGASFLFLFPIKEGQILKADDVRDIDWGSLLLFGSGLSLGKLLFSTGLAKMAGEYLILSLSQGHFFIFLLVLITFTIFATEVASNTASANILLPIVIASAQEIGMQPQVPATAVALACSLAFMLPVATPPNAIVYGSGKVEIPHMMKMGFIMNFFCVLLLTLVFYLHGKA
jgi:sodium-dependent dicarboxylate transporter 2/3/5